MLKIRFLVLASAAFLVGCARPHTASVALRPVDEVDRVGDEIMVAGQLFHTGTPVVLWSDPGGFNAYTIDGMPDGTVRAPDADDRVFGVRHADGSSLERLSTETDWTLPDLQQQVDQFVLHYDAAGTSRRCFEILHQVRGLSVHFLLDLDGTIYQTLDVQERAWHSTKANDRSIGIEIANIGAYPPKDSSELDRWYTNDQFERAIRIPAGEGSESDVPSQFVARPARSEPIVGRIQGQWLKMYDLTNEQYESLIHLTATLCRLFPALTCDYPRNPDGSLIDVALSDDAFDQYQGIIGHFHVQQNKVDPGPAFNWERVVQGARSLQSERHARVSTRPGRSTGSRGRGGGDIDASHREDD